MWRRRSWFSLKGKADIQGQTRGALLLHPALSTNQPADPCNTASYIDTNVVAYVLLAVLVLGAAATAIRIMREYERAVVFTLGRFSGVKGPGLIILIPFVQQLVRVDLRTIVLDVPSQDVISRDNVSVKVNAVIYFRGVDPAKAVIQVENFMTATSQ